MRPYLSHPRSRVKEPVFHVSLNPNPKDNLDDNTLLEIAHYYMDHMGFRDQPYVIFRHNDTDRTHLHVISGCIRPDGSHVTSVIIKSLNGPYPRDRNEVRADSYYPGPGTKNL